MEFKDVLKQRKSIRKFTDQQIDKKQLEEIVKLAQDTPTWVNSQPYKVYIATGNTLKEIKAHHLELVQNEVPTASFWEPMSREFWDEKPRKNMEQMTNDLLAYYDNDMTEFGMANATLFNCQAAIYLAIPKNSSNYSIYDLGAFSMSLMLAAKDAGIDSVPAYEFVKYPEYLDKVLDVDKNYAIVMGIGLGYIDQDAKINHKKTTREPLENLLTIKE